MTYSQFEVCKDTIPPSLTHIVIYLNLEKNGYQIKVQQTEKTKQYADTRKTYTRK